uniref:Protein arginine methyltransferase NDUFAF7 n=1 Tax=Schistocephalus solidus TaxID=70667 RepID=A0A0X3NL55_SCHSO
MSNLWRVNERLRFATQTPFDIVEFGPGRGTLLSNILRAISKFPKVASEFQKLHLVERSDRLRAVQQSTLGPLLDALKLSPAIHWHSSLDEIPRGQCSYYLAHEFFDALPIHRFQKVNGKWHEVFVDVMDAHSESSTHGTAEQLIFRASQPPTLTMSVYLQLAGDLENRNCVEVCPEAGAILQKIAQRVADDGGAALVVDYGHVGESGDTLRAFKNHELHDPLKDPGQADITADVDFAFLRRSVEATNTPVVVHGPVTQAYFLVHMGFMARLKVLVHKCHLEEDKKNLIASSEMLLGSDKMGKRFKFMAILPRSDSVDQSYVPAGFFPTWPSASTIQPSSASKT